jgi:hypothetical protein
LGSVQFGTECASVLERLATLPQQGAATRRSIDPGSTILGDK